VYVAVVGRHDEPAWGFAARLNEVRNRMAHYLEPGDLDELLDPSSPSSGPPTTPAVGAKLAPYAEQQNIDVEPIACLFPSIGAGTTLRAMLGYVVV
jgi:hypothetical protein